MSDKKEESKSTGDWRLKQIALVAYAVATAVGMFYGNAYYEHFGIVLLDYASPIDLLFIALANLDVMVVALTVPLLFLCFCLIVLLASFIIIVLLALSVTLGWTTLLLCVGTVVGVLALAVAIVRVAAQRAYWLQAAFAAIRADRQERAERVRATADQGDVPEAARQPLRLAVAYRRASQHTPAWKTIDPQPYARFVRGPFLASFDPVVLWIEERILDIRKRVPKVSKDIGAAYCSCEAKKGSNGRRWRFRSWQAIDLTPRFFLVALVLIFLAYLLYAAS